MPATPAFRQGSPSRRARARRLLLESLEDRSLMATLVLGSDSTPAIDHARAYLSSQAAALGLNSPELTDLAHVFTHASSFGSVERFEQRVQGVPVYNAEIALTVLDSGEVTYVYNGYQPGLELASTMPALAPAAARAIAMDEIGTTGPFRHDQAQLTVFADKAGTHLAYQVELVPTMGISGSFEVIVDARTGSILQSRNRAQYVNGSGMVFNPDPLTSANAAYGLGITDANDADSTQVNAQRQSVTLLDITQAGGNFSLVGPYAQIVDVEAPMKGLFTQPTSTFNFTRSQDGFEAVNAYYHLDRFLRYLDLTLNLNAMPIQYSGGVKFDPSGENGADNSHYDPITGELVYGEGGVDDAEDADVIIHELGHGLHDWVTGGNASTGDGLSEGVGDYFAQAYSRAMGLLTASSPAYQWTYSWDGHNEYWEGRVTNYPATYPSGLTGAIHDDGQIWATANMNVYDVLGAAKTNTLMIEGLAMTGVNSTQEDAAQALLQAAFNLGYAQTEIHSAYLAYQAAGYSVTEPMPPTQIQGTVFNDANGNGLRDTGETGQPGWTVYIDSNNNGTRDNGSGTFNSADVPKPIPDPGLATSQNVVSGLPGGITDLNVTLSLTHTYDSDLNITLIAPNNARVRLAARAGGSGSNFSNTVFDDQATVPIGAGNAPFAGSFQPSSPLSVLNGIDPNGIWRLEVADVALLDSGNLTSWRLAFTTGEPFDVTDAAGAYVLDNLTAGTHIVREVVQPAWTQTAPDLGFHSVTLATAQTITGMDFGNTQGVVQPNTPPEISDISNQLLLEDGSVTANFTISDSQTPASSLVLLVTSSNPALLPANSIFITGTGPDRTVRFTPVANEFGAATVTFTVRDSRGLTDVDTAVVTVLSVNDRPSFNRGGDPTVLNIWGSQTLTNWASAISPGPSNEAGQTIQFNLTNTNAALFTAGPTIAPNGTLSFTPAPGAVGVATITVVARDNGGTTNGGVDASLPQTFTITVTNPPTFQVLGSTWTNTGATVDFGRDLKTSTLNLYDVASNVFGAADLTLVGATVGNVRGSLVVDPSLRKVSFVKTAGALLPDTYTLTLRGAADGFQDTNGTLLDGDGDGTPGGNYVRTFVISPPPAEAISLTVGNFARGPGQPVNLPANATTGIPISFSNGGGITSATFRLHYDPALLTIPNLTGAAVAPGLTGATVTVNTIGTPGIAIVQFNSLTPLPEGTTRFMDLRATVPSGAPYLSKHVLDLSSISLNNGAIPARDDDGVAVVAYVGDTSGNGSYSSSDVTHTMRLAAALEKGLQSYRLLDPLIIADVTGNGSFSGSDSSRLLQAVFGVATADIPTPLPSVSLVAGGPDPKLSIPTDLVANLGQELTIPINIDSIVDLTGDGLDSADLIIHYDATVLDVTGVSLGSLVANQDWIIGSRIDPLAGRVLISLAGTTPLEGVFQGEFAQLHATVKSSAASGSFPLNLAASARDLPFRTQLNEGWLTLIPAPTNADDDPGVDGRVTILPAADAPTPRQQRAQYLASLLGSANTSRLPGAATAAGVVGPETLASVTLRIDAALLELLAEGKIASAAASDAGLNPLARVRRR